MGRERNSICKHIIWGIIYWISLTISFAWSLQINYSNAFPLSFSAWKYILSCVFVILFLIAKPMDESILSLSVTIILYLVIFPIAIVYSCQDRETTYFISVALCMLVVEFLARYISPSRVTVKVGRINPSSLVITSLFVILLLSLFFVFRERGIPSFKSLDFSITYDIRSSYELSSLTSKLFQITTKAIIPFLIALYYLKKKYKMVAFLIIVQFTFFLWLANKTTVFSIGVLVIGYFIGKSVRGTLLFSRIMSLGMLGISFAQGFISKSNDGLNKIIDLPYSLLVRRSIFLPAYFKYCYYEFFVVKNNPHEGLLGTFIAPILTRIDAYDPYKTMPYTRIIGDRYYSMGSSCNTGLFGAEMAHFGYFGILVAALLLVILLLCIKKCEASNGKIFTCCLMIYTVISLTDAGTIGLIDFSPMFLVALIALLFETKEYNLGNEFWKRFGLLSKTTK